MSKPKPKLLLDTNVGQKLSSAKSTFDIQGIKRKIAHEYRLVVSPETIIEILCGVIGATSDDHLRADQSKLRILVGRGIPDILYFPMDFSLRTVLGVHSTVPSFNPNHFREWVRTVLAATGLAELMNGDVRLRNRGNKTFGLNKTEIANQQELGKIAHREWLQRAVKGSTIFPSREVWAKFVGAHLKVELTDEQSMILGKRLSAAYEYQKITFETAADNPTYNVTKHDGDWVDNQQLYYLCDPTLYFLTEETEIRSKCRKSDQCDRILLLKQF
jgi:hypothetical protein